MCRVAIFNNENSFQWKNILIEIRGIANLEVFFIIGQNDFILRQIRRLFLWQILRLNGYVWLINSINSKWLCPTFMSLTVCWKSPANAEHSLSRFSRLIGAVIFEIEDVDDTSVELLGIEQDVPVDCWTMLLVGPGLWTSIIYALINTFNYNLYLLWFYYTENLNPGNYMKIILRSCITI